MAQSKWWNIGGSLMVGLFVAYFDRTNLSVSLPQLSRDMGFAGDSFAVTSSWALTIFLMGYALRPMDARLFRPEPMGMEQTLLGLSLAERISFDAERDTINYEGFQVRTTDDVDRVRREVENHCRTIGHRIAVIVNYDGFTLDPVVSDAFFSMITYLQQRYYSSASRYTTSAFMRLKLGASLTERALAPHVFETLQEAHAFMTTQMPAPDRSNHAQKS
jgi:MFS family permease